MSARTPFSMKGVEYERFTNVARAESTLPMKNSEGPPSTAQDPSATLDEFCRLIREMTLLKFLLTEEVTTDELLELSKISVDKLLYLHDKSVQLGHASVSCTGISSTATKKVLLILKLQRGWGFSPCPPMKRISSRRRVPLARILFQAEGKWRKQVLGLNSANLSRIYPAAKRRMLLDGSWYTCSLDEFAASCGVK